MNDAPAAPAASDQPTDATSLVAMPTSLTLPPGLVTVLHDLMQVAERALPGKTGAAKKAWVVDAAMRLADMVDIPVLPNVVEEPLKRMVVEGAVETIWALTLSQKAVVPLGAHVPLGALLSSFFHKH